MQQIEPNETLIAAKFRWGDRRVTTTTAQSRKVQISPVLLYYIGAGGNTVSGQSERAPPTLQTCSLIQMSSGANWVS